MTWNQSERSTKVALFHYYLHSFHELTTRCHLKKGRTSRAPTRTNIATDVTYEIG